MTGTAQTWQQTWFNIDPSREPEISLFRDPRLRRAVHLAIDRAAINEIATENLGKASRGPVSQESWALLPDKDYYDDAPNLEESYQLRDAAGYADGVPGVYLSFATEFHRRMAEPVHNQLREAGFELEFLENSEAVIIEWILGTEEWQMALLTWESPFDPDPVLRNSIVGLMSWQYGGEPGRSDPALHPDDEVLQALEGSRQLVEGGRRGAQPGRPHPALRRVVPETGRTTAGTTTSRSTARAGPGSRTCAGSSSATSTAGSSATGSSTSGSIRRLAPAAGRFRGLRRASLNPPSA